MGGVDGTADAPGRKRHRRGRRAHRDLSFGDSPGVNSPKSEGVSGKVAVVTGGGRGLGRHVAIGLARRGVRVALAARSIEQLAETERSITQGGGTALGVAVDVGAPDQVAHLRTRVLDELGVPTILINA